ncbi:cell envelope integrity protein TolA [Aquabacterium sp.]|uniref:cell envelope integrity protein TolA n=1 Tax=Aquabacterium sp. TaxID=1872578 RepID=UPI002E30EFF0|nr:cell envelope integrity protein TolA [Aquabacterium sp.]HEX5310498.1 cell envelope integrity protein TolA [Aquabacterium sp.]
MSGAMVLADSTRFRPQDAGGWKPGLAMALFAHLLLVGALALGVHWKIQPPPPVEAEMWTEVPKVQEGNPQPEPPPPPPPQPAEVTPPPKPVPPAEPAVEKPLEKPADMAMVPVKPKAKAEKEAKKPAKKEPKEVFLPDPPKKVPPKAAEKPPVKAPAKPESVKPDPKAEAKAKAEEARAKAAEAAKAKAEAEKLAAQRRANLDRLMRNLAQDQIASAGLSDSYIGRLRARIKANIVFPRDGVAGNPAALVKVECNSEGRITRSTIIAASGNEQWDQAVLRALERTQVLPQDEHKRVPCPFEFNFRPQDF